MKDRVLEDVEIVDVVGERVSLKRKGKDYVGLCPFHADKTPSLSVSPSKRIFKCWSCGVGGDVIRFVQLDQRVEFREALTILARRAGIDVATPQGDSGSSEKRHRLRNVMTWARDLFARQLHGTGGRAASEYAYRRGLSDETLKRFAIGFAPDDWTYAIGAASKVGVPMELLQQAGLVATSESGRTYDRFRNRLIFPIHDGQGCCVAFGGRTLGDDPAKYLNSPETSLFSKSRILYGLDQARDSIRSSREAVVVEGYLDAVLLHQHGLTNVVATLGTALSDSHVKLLRPLADRLVLCFDRDEAGVRAADRAAEVGLRHRIDVRVALLDPGQDPADYVIRSGPDALKSLLQSTIGALEFKWNQTRAAFDEQDERGKREAIERFLQFIANVSASGGVDPIEQGVLVGRVADLLSLPSATVYDWLARQKPTAQREAAAPTPDTSESSAYDASVAALPAGLVSAVEELFGLTLAEPQLLAQAESGLAASSRWCESWRRLYEVLRELHDRPDGFTRTDVLASCQDGTSCELVSRSAARVAPAFVTDEQCELVFARVASELEVLRMESLQQQMGSRESCEEVRTQAFGALLDVARRQHGPLATAHRRNSRS